MLIKSKHPNFQNSTLNLPIVGETEVVNGLIDVPKEVADLLLGNPSDWEKAEAEVEADEELEEVEETEGDGLDKLSLEEMIEFAKTNGLKGYQLFSKDKEKMIAFLRKKLTK